MDISSRIMAVGTLCILIPLSFPVMSKEYNRGTHIAPQQRAKVDKTIAKARAQPKTVGEIDEAGAIVSDGVTQTDCGKLAIGNVEAPKFGNKAIKVDRDIIITGDVINIATGCKKERR